MAIQLFSITLENAFMLSPNVKHFVFRPPDDLSFDSVPGQFITMHFEQHGKTLRRSYSIANVPKQNNRIEFAAGYIEGGAATNLLFNLKPGDTVNINGPFGRLTLKEEIPQRYILAATSTGITPYRAMIPELKRRIEINPHLQVVILQGVQKREDILYQDEFLALAASSAQISFYACLSKESPENMQTYERPGYVQSIFPSLMLCPEKDVVYLCGNPGMIDDAFSYLKDHGFAMQHIIREKYISS